MLPLTSVQLTSLFNYNKSCIPLVVRLVWVVYGLYLVKESVHGKAIRRTVYRVSKTRYLYPTNTNLITNLSYLREHN